METYLNFYGQVTLKKGISKSDVNNVLNDFRVTSKNDAEAMVNQDRFAEVIYNFTVYMDNCGRTCFRFGGRRQWYRDSIYSDLFEHHKEFIESGRVISSPDICNIVTKLADGKVCNERIKTHIDAEDLYYSTEHLRNNTFKVIIDGKD